jgi:hypothetical protein
VGCCVLSHLLFGTCCVLWLTLITYQQVSVRPTPLLLIAGHPYSTQAVGEFSSGQLAFRQREARSSEDQLQFALRWR